MCSVKTSKPTKQHIRCLYVVKESSVRFRPESTCFHMTGLRSVFVCVQSRARMKHPSDCGNRRCWMPQLRHAARSHKVQTGARRHQRGFSLSLTPWNNRTQTHNPSAAAGGQWGAGRSGPAIFSRQPRLSTCVRAFMLEESQLILSVWFQRRLPSCSQSQGVYELSTRPSQRDGFRAAPIKLFWIKIPTPNAWNVKVREAWRCFLTRGVNPGTSAVGTVWFYSK